MSHMILLIPNFDRTKFDSLLCLTLLRIRKSNKAKARLYFHPRNLYNLWQNLRNELYWISRSRKLCGDWKQTLRNDTENEVFIFAVITTLP